MRVRVSYAIVVDDRYRRALRFHYGIDSGGKATRSELKEHFEQNGGTISDDLLWEYDHRND